MAAKLIPTPSQTVGPFFHLALDRPQWSDLTREGSVGERIVVTGRVQDKPLDPKFLGFGRVSTDAEGRFRFMTIRPGPVPGRGNALQAPHIAVAVFARGLLRQLATRIYFADEPANETDPVLSSIADPAVRKTLLARRTETADPATYCFDIVLQGEGETAFFEV
jgi:protocatechuate 3,4-dioxygenase, alpha subunit